MTWPQVAQRGNQGSGCVTLAKIQVESDLLQHGLPEFRWEWERMWDNKGIVQGAWWVTKADEGESSQRCAPFPSQCWGDRKNTSQDCLEGQVSDLLDSQGLSIPYWEHWPWLLAIHGPFEECVTPHSALASCMIGLIKYKFPILNEGNSTCWFSVICIS